MPADLPEATYPTERAGAPAGRALRIDAHQHFWHYLASEYGWIDDSMGAIRRDFLPADLLSELGAVRVDGTIAVQARQSLAESDWLLDLCRSHPFIRGVVGWVPLAGRGSAVGSLLDHYSTHPCFKGVRHVLQAESDSYFEGVAFNDAVAELAEHRLIYELLILERQLPAATAWVDRHPSLRVVLDHSAKPVVGAAPSRAWRGHIRDLARRPNLFCKFSGLVTEVPGWQWTPDLLRPYLEVVLEAFGPDRLMFGSDWPVCLVATSYARWFQAVESLLGSMTPAERSAILGGTATVVYQLGPWSPAR